MRAQHPIARCDRYRHLEQRREILPGSGGYYMEILAPWLMERGAYIAANRDGSLPQYMADHRKLLQRLADEPHLRERMGRAARASVQRLGGWSAYGSAFRSTVEAWAHR